MSEDVCAEIERLFQDIGELEQILFESRARYLVREYLESGWIDQGLADRILSLFPEPTL